MVRINLNRLKFYTGQRNAAVAEVRRIQSTIDSERTNLTVLRTKLVGEEMDGILYSPSASEAKALQAEIQATEDRIALQLASLGPAQARLLDASQFADTLINFARQMGANLEGIN